MCWTRAVHRVWTLTPVVGGVVTVAGGDDITGCNYADRPEREVEERERERDQIIIKV